MYVELLWFVWRPTEIGVKFLSNFLTLLFCAASSPLLKPIFAMGTNTGSKPAKVKKLVKTDNKAEKSKNINTATDNKKKAAKVAAIPVSAKDTPVKVSVGSLMSR